jgi:hypothetical protein
MPSARPRDDEPPGDDQVTDGSWEGLPGDEEALDGAPMMDAMVYCPYCAEAVEIALDPGGGARQRYVQDCEVCCQPWLLDVSWTADGAAWVDVQCDDGR